MNDEVSAVGDLLWTPSPATADASRMAHYMRWINERRARTTLPPFDSYAALWRFSVDDLEEFWASLWDYFEIGPRTFTSVLDRREMPGAKWFAGATLNYVNRIAAQRQDTLAVIHHDEQGRRARLTYGELMSRVVGCQATLRSLGVGPGDRVVGYVTNAPEALIAFLASASLGAIWSSCPPEFGVESVLDRFRQIAPKVLFACVGYQYGGKRFDRRADVERLRAALGSLEACVWIGEPDEAPPASVAGQRSLRFGDIAPLDTPLDIEPVAFDHPLWILFSSGTTGLPKPIVHGHGGMLLEHLKVLALHSDLGAGDRFFWFSTTGWMMWNYLVSGLQLGATLVLYDGSPGHPDLSRLWRLAAEERVTYFGVSAPFLMACKAAGIVPRDAFDLAALRAVGSTGAPLPAPGFDWVYRSVKSDLLLGSVSGGTDLCTAFLASCPLLPVHAGELQCRCLGAHVLAFDERGQAVTGQVGELVIASPMPCMPVGFWNDPEGARYRESYFEHFPGVWRHGDWILITERGSALITGRSDATLNRGGVRMGTSEFYRVVEELEPIQDSVVVDTSDASGTGKLWLFVVMRPGHALDAELVQTIQRTLRSRLSPRHVPDEIRAVQGVPRTLSGKKLEVPIKRLLAGARVIDVVNPGTLQNPEALYGLLAAAGIESPRGP